MAADPINGSPAGAGAIGNASGGIKPASGADKADGSFEALLDETIGKVASLQKETEKAIAEITGGGGDIVEAMVAMQKADLSFQVMVEVRNKLVSAYEEIMRMQV
ncbi:MAG TPA: flagellar hook-basal body complex protein FliE [Nitrospirae bacterium]|nr:flagellar hook-basal body complex protein FliE [Nitrospirota bacterium]